MGNRLWRFDCEILDGRKGQHSTSAVILIRLARWIKTEGGQVIISPELMTAEEIDRYFDELKLDLDAVAKNAKVALRKANLYQRREFLTRGGFPFCYGCDSRLAKEIRHVSMHCSSGRLRQH